jgi:hypothetical protein
LGIGSQRLASQGGFNSGLYYYRIFYPETEKRHQLIEAMLAEEQRVNPDPDAVSFQ